jgi:RNA polymerase sigma-70 factor (ECF subfamily)
MSALQSSILKITASNRKTRVIQRPRPGNADSQGSAAQSSHIAVTVPFVPKDWKLAQQAMAGDSNAWEELMKTHAGRLYRTAFSVVRNKEDAEDAVQDSLCRAFVNLRSFRGQSSFATWLTRILINSALMIRRKRTGREVASLDERNDSHPEQLPDRLVHAGPNPEQICATNQIHERLVRQIFQLPPLVRAACQLYVLEGRSTSDSCEALGIRKDAFKARIFRGRRIILNSLRPTVNSRLNASASDGG